MQQKPIDSTPLVVGLGQCSIDVIGTVDEFPGPDEKTELNNLRIQGGGPVATALVTLARWGIRTALIGVVGDDPFGDFIRIDLAGEGIDLSTLVRAPSVRSQFALVVAETGTGNRNIFWDRGVQAPPGLGSLDLSMIPRASCLHLDGLMAEASIAAARLAGAHGVPVMYDGGTLRDGSIELACLSDYLVVSHKFSIQYLSADDPDRAARELAGLGPAMVTVTLGAGGSVTFTKDGTFTQRALEIDAVDTTGAGDVFHGALIYGILQGWDAATSIRTATAAAGLKCLEPGGRAGIPTFEKALKAAAGIEGPS
ncbi:carbohydrate kinase family protein [Thermodesulfobacteriota bacterium]